MSYFAEIDGNGVVLRVIVAEQNFIDTGAVGDPLWWVHTSYDTQGGIHSKGGVPFRKNYAGVGYTYDPALDAFIPPKAHPSWVLDTGKGQFKAPKDQPLIGPHMWNEEKQEWVFGFPS